MTRIQLRRGTAAQWTSANPVLADGEMGIETDTKKFKFGNGVTNWNSLEYVITGEIITDYTELDNLPKINNVTLTGNKSSSDLGLQEELTNGNGINISNGVISIDTNVVATLNDIPDLTDYVTNSSLSSTLLNYATQSDISDMASRTWVAQQGYLTGITGAMVESAIGYTPYDGTTNPSGFISGINSTDVINALGYTPYSSANPAGYTTNIGTVTSVNSVSPNANGNISLSKLEGSATRPTYNNSDLALLSDVTSSQGARIDDTTPSATTTYSSNKIESLIPDVSNFITSSDLSTALSDYVLSSDLATTLSGYVTNSDLTTILAGYAETSDIPTDTADLTNSAGFITISALNGYATQQWVQNQGYTTNVGTVTSVNNTLPDANGNVTITIPDVSDMATKTWVGQQGYLTSSDLSGYATQAWVGQQGYLVASDLNGYATESFVTSQGYITGITSSDVITALGYTPYNSTNPDGYITASALTPYALSANLATVATSGSYNDLTNKPTIPSTANMVTTNTAQDISGRKTFIGEKAIYFKQSATTDKLGFTLYNPSGTELAALEWRPNTISGNALLALNCPQSGSSNYVGFRYWANINIVAPRPTTNGTYFIPVNITNGTTTVTANNNGTVNISTLLPDTSGFVDTTSNQSVGGTKTFSDLRVNQYIRNSSGKMIFSAIGSLFSMGDTTCELVLDGSRTRPKYYNGTTNTEIALLSDIPTVPTVDQTYDNASTNPQSGTAVEEAINTVKRNVGELVYSSLPLTDAGLHLLDGALISGSGSYSAFVDYIADLYTNNPTANYFTDETTWQNTVTQYGVCGKFVYDSTNNTVRLPKVTGIIEGTIDTSALGDLVQAGLPNITGSLGYLTSDGAPSGSGNGALRWNTATAPTKAQMISGTSAYDPTFDASRSSSIYKDNFNKVQPQTIKCFIYIVIANSTKTDIQVDIDEIATDLNGKADTDLSNTTDQAKILMSGMGMPSDKFIELSVGATQSTYTAPANGYFVMWFVTQNVSQPAMIYMENKSCGDIGGSVATSNDNGQFNYMQCYTPVNKGDLVQIQYATTGSWMYQRLRFIYAQGSESEAN